MRIMQPKELTPKSYVVHDKVLRAHYYRLRIKIRGKVKHELDFITLDQYVRWCELNQGKFNCKAYFYLRYVTGDQHLLEVVKL